jgi:hypothetical protein
VQSIDTLSVILNQNPLELQESALDKLLLPEEGVSFLRPDSSNYYPVFDLRYSMPNYTYFSDEFLTVSPLRFGFYNGFEGGDLLGVNNRFQVTDFLSGNLNLTFSSSFYGPYYPERYHNGSISLDLTWRLHDRVRINTFGQYSVREGMNPAFAPMINGGNYYGGEIQVKLFKNFGIGVGFVNSYYQKSWIFQPTARPVIFD